MRKLLYVTPHLSTGGLPQYLYKKIEVLKSDFEIFVVEYSNITGGVLVVQRNRILDILEPDHFFSLGENKEELLEIIDRIKPMSIHLEEIPEFFMDYALAEKVYSPERSYSIVETSHDSSYDTTQKLFTPDKFMFVSQYQIEQYKDFNIPKILVEYPIEYQQRPDRNQALSELGLNPDKKHVLHVGLFTPRKNQKEFFEYARSLPEIEFHSVGNQAENFKSYWEPLMQDKPSNVTVWGERNDVEKFYQSMDLFLFTSKGTIVDKETMPLVIREAIAWNLPILIYNLPVYLNYFDKFENIKYLIENFESNKTLIKDTLQMNKKLFTASFQPEENRLHFTYHGDGPVDFLVSIKDIDSRTVIWSYTKRSSYTWCVPSPMHLYNFDQEREFGGFRIEFYKDDQLLDVENIRLKYPTKYKPSVDLTNAEPTFTNYNEFFVYDIFKDCDMKDCGVVIDIGANVGLWTEWILRQNARKVYCVEPNHQALKFLRQHYGTNDKITIIDKAIYHELTKLTLHLNESNSLVSALEAHTGRYTGIPLDKSYEVDTITVQKLIEENNLTKIDLFKIDIEGGEFTLFQHLPESVFDVVDKFLIETHSFYYDDGQEKVMQIKKQMIERGYSVKQFFNHMLFCEKIKEC